MERKQRERYREAIKKGILVECVLVVLLAGAVTGVQREEHRESASGQVLMTENDYIKWVDFNVSYEALCQAYEWDTKTHGTEHALGWVELLAYTAARTGGTFNKDALKTMEKAACAFSEGEKTWEELTGELKYYSYYLEAYDAVLGGMVGEYERETTAGSQGGGTGSQSVGAGSQSSWAESQGVGAGSQSGGAESQGGGVGSQSSGAESQSGGAGSQSGGTESQSGGTESQGYERVYGLKSYFPLARGFEYTHYDDFGAGRSYGYQRKHLGHDMMGLVGTPIWMGD